MTFVSLYATFRLIDLTAYSQVHVWAAKFRRCRSLRLPPPELEFEEEEDVVVVTVALDTDCAYEL